MKKTLLFLPFLSIALCIVGCNDDDTVYPDAVIVEELPKLYIGSNKSSFVIQSQQELEKAFTLEELRQVEELQQIDFKKYTLLLGYGTYGNEVSSMEHYFFKTETTYIYLLKISGLATRPDAFLYGILVEKLPNSTKVVFEIEEIYH